MENQNILIMEEMGPTGHFEIISFVTWENSWTAHKWEEQDRETRRIRIVSPFTIEELS